MKINQTFKNIKRIQQISTVFVRHGFRSIIEEIGLDKYIILKAYRQENDTKLSVAIRLRMCFEELGTTFIKLGQMLSIRPDMIPREFVEEFKKLQDSAKTVELSEIRNQIEKEFEAEVESVFAEFEALPIGAASIAQVHKARLSDGRQVVVKVRRPGIRRQIETDISILFILANLLDRYFSAAAIINPLAIVDEFARTIYQEVDFIHEAQNIKQFYKNFEDDDSVVIPDVVWEFTGKRVLTMEFLDGIPLNNIEKLKAKGYELDKFAEIGSSCFFKMVFLDGFFHGDIHGGNIMALGKDRIGLIDFGIAGRFDDRLLQEVASLLIALATKDFRALARIYLRISLSGSESVSPEALARDMQRVIEPILGLELSKIDSSELLLNMAGVAQKHHLQIPQELLLLFKAIISLEGMGRELNPEFDVLKVVSTFARTVVVDRYKPERLMGDMVMVLRDLADMGRDMPSQMNSILRSAEAGSLGVDFRIRDSETLKHLKAENWRLVSSVMMAGGAVSTAILQLTETFGFADFIGLSLFAAGAAGMFLLLLKGNKS